MCATCAVLAGAYAPSVIQSREIAELEASIMNTAHIMESTISIVNQATAQQYNLLQHNTEVADSSASIRRELELLANLTYGKRSRAQHVSHVLGAAMELLVNYSIPVVGYNRFAAAYGPNNITVPAL